MKKFFLLMFAAMFLVSGCGGGHRTAEFPDVEGVYDLQGTLKTDCWSGDEQTFGVFDRVAFLQPAEAPSQVMMSGAWSGVIAGVLDEGGVFTVEDGAGDPRITTSYQGTFSEDWSGEVVYHEGTFSVKYTGLCYDNRDGYLTIQFWGGRTNSSSPPQTGDPSGKG